MKTWLPGGVALLQLVVLLFMAGEREWLLEQDLWPPEPPLLAELLAPGSH